MTDRNRWDWKSNGDITRNGIEVGSSQSFACRLAECADACEGLSDPKSEIPILIKLWESLEDHLDVEDAQAALAEAAANGEAPIPWADAKRLRRKVDDLEAVLGPACDLAQEHLRGDVQLGEFVFNGIPKVVKERDALRDQVEHHQQRDDEACVALGSACHQWEIVERIKTLRARLEEAEGVLRFYGDEENHKKKLQGNRARAFLEEGEG